ncbi:hypothetical protein VTL71DRAFT_2077 [Oculimacula yallundae]|uniref:DUF6594 domain-containing protein n=1 Tax=Oculimacula yallundae TaxID=86028 RepID=A0ABR4C947_9HELO
MELEQFVDVEQDGENNRTGNPPLASLGAGTFAGIITPGYPKLADLMARHGEVAIFRRFRSLNLFNLMRLQAKIVTIERKLRKILENQEKENPFIIQDFAEMCSGNENKVEALVEQLHSALTQYNEMLLQVSKVESLKDPHEADLHLIHRWLQGLKPGEGNSFLRGAERFTWSDELEPNEFFVVKTEQSEADAATGKTVDWLITNYNRIVGRKALRHADQALGVIQYSGLKTTAKFIITLLSSMLPALSILGLYFEKDLLKRIGIMIGMTFAFAAALTFGTSARRIEIFSATAAFAAVEVVFIGSTDVGNGTRPG